MSEKKATEGESFLWLAAFAGITVFSVEECGLASRTELTPVMVESQNNSRLNSSSQPPEKI